MPKVIKPGMVLNIRGTNGSGKSTAVRHLLDRIGGLESMTPHYENGRKKPLYYTHEETKLALVGHYETQCGGGDTINGYDKLFGLVMKLCGQGWHVLYESMQTSADTKQIIAVKNAGYDDIRVVYLTTSLEECIKRIEARRHARGNNKPFNPKSTIGKFRGTETSRPKLIAAGIHTRRASVEQAGKVIHRWLLERNGLTITR